MSEIPALVFARWPLASGSAADWLRDLAGDGLTGFMPPPLPDAAWVLNSMYEHEDGPTDVSYDEYHRDGLEAGLIEPHVGGGIDLDAVGTVTGGGWVATSTQVPVGVGCAGLNSRSAAAIR